MAEQPNDASRKSKAEGDRFGSEGGNTGASERDGYSSTDERGSGISNRSADEEMSNQDAVPRRGESKPGANAGHGDSMDDRRSER
jgi:hypothetical protein